MEPKRRVQRHQQRRWSQWAAEAVAIETHSGSAGMWQWRRCKVEEGVRRDDDISNLPNQVAGEEQDGLEKPKSAETEGREKREVRKCDLSDLREPCCAEVHKLNTEHLVALTFFSVAHT